MVAHSQGSSWRSSQVVCGRSLLRSSFRVDRCWNVGRQRRWLEVPFQCWHTLSPHPWDSCWQRRSAGPFPCVAVWGRLPAPSEKRPLELLPVDSCHNISEKKALLKLLGYSMALSPIWECIFKVHMKPVTGGFLLTVSTQLFFLVYVM